jgi:hypothetical protein
VILPATSKAVEAANRSLQLQVEKMNQAFRQHCKRRGKYYNSSWDQQFKRMQFSIKKALSERFFYLGRRPQSGACKGEFCTFDIFHLSIDRSLVFFLVGKAQIQTHKTH